ncbi:MAG TPA: hypothetical protein VFZ57_06665 [Thermoanaerobaculia bacterium]|nr:hypothetical protein [Thermoanaerobaculia bacterium]
MAAKKKSESARIAAALRELAAMHLDVPRLLERLVSDERKLTEESGKLSLGHGGPGIPLIPRVEAVVRVFRRDLYVLFLESERTAREVAENLPAAGIRRLLGAPVDADVAVVRARLAKQIDEKRAQVEVFRGRRGMPLARAARHVAAAWAESDADRVAGHSA